MANSSPMRVGVITAVQALEVVLVLLAAASVGRANSKQDLMRCKSETAPEKSVLYCSRAIDSGRLSDQELAVAYHSRGNAYLEQHELDKAIADYDRAIALSADYADAFYDRAQAYLREPVRQPGGRRTDAEGRVYIDLGAGDYPKAIQDLSRVVQLRPDDARAFVARANIYLDMGDYDRAIADWGQVIRLQPNDPTSLYARGLAYQEKGDNDGAIGDFSEILRLKPDEADALLYRGESYLHKGDYDRAIQDFDQLLRLNPHDNGGLYNRGDAYLHKGDYDRAIQDYSDAIRVYPKNSAAFHNRGVAYQAKGDYERAIRDFDQSIQLDPTYAEFHDRGLAYFNMGQYDQAAQDYDQAIHLNPKDAEAFRFRGALHDAKGEYSEAIGDFNEAIRLNPNDLNFFFGRGLTRFYMREFPAAQQDLAKLSSYPYGALWLYMARARAGQEARSGLVKDSAAMNLNVWPGPVISLYLGQATPQSVLAASKNADPVKEREQLCEAYFYLGQQAWIAGNHAQARQFFQQTLETHVTRFVEYAGAQAELKGAQGATGR